MDTPAQEAEQVIAQYRRTIQAYALQAARGNQAEAEDIVADVYVRIWRALPQLQHRKALSSWLYRITTRIAIDRHRARTGDRLIDAEPVDGLRHAAEQPPHDRALEDHARRRIVARLLVTLSPHERQVVLRRYGLGACRADGPRARKDIGLELGVSRQAVLRSEHRAFEAMRAHLRPTDRDTVDI